MPYPIAVTPPEGETASRCPEAAGRPLCEAPVSDWCQKAIALGFSKAVPLKCDTLQPRVDVREMCAADKCRAYGKNWTCPPHCGTLSECAAGLRAFSWGILLQTVGITEKTIDTKAYRRTEE